MRRIESRLFVQDTCQLGEGPFWFEDRLCWVDIDAGKLHSVDGSGGDRATLDLGRRIGAAAPIDGEHFLVALEDGVGIVHRVSGVIELLASPEKNVAGSRFNDGKCDAAGRFVAGTLNMKGRTGASALYSFGCDGGVETLHAPATISNGLAWSADGAT
ncbi:MAG: SMP-30/gluconolactonase/LRE family protein, partial [Terrimicrobiaceae bacterium]